MLLGSQLVFNLGFYAVVPFLAVVQREDHLLGGVAIGLVLGVRTFAQQGMFLLGGVLVDRWGPRALIGMGCFVRCAGFATLGGAQGLGWLLVGAVLTGFGGALFSPALQVLVAHAEERRPPGPSAHRATLFAVLAVVGEVGAAVGPVIGAALLGGGFSTVAWSGAVLFALVGGVLMALLPGRAPQQRSAADAPGRRCQLPASLRQPRFVAFAALGSVNLLAYNQLYLSVPFELQRVGADERALGWLFVLVSVLTITTQLPLARGARRIGPARSLPLGFVLTSLAFAVLVVAAPLPVPTSHPLLPVALAVALLTVGHLVLTPVCLDLVPRFASQDGRGSYFGLLATAGGTAVLLGSLTLGGLLDGADQVGAAARWPWLLLALVSILPALLIHRTLPRPRPGTPRVAARPTTERTQR